MRIKIDIEKFITGLILIYCMATVKVWAQAMPLTQNVQNRWNELTLETKSDLFTGFRALDALELQRSHLKNKEIQDSIFSLSFTPHPFQDRIFQDNWLRWEGKNFMMTLDPFLFGTIGFSDRKDGLLYQAAEGATLRSVFLKQLTFQATVYGAQTQFPDYVSDYILQHSNEIPGEKNGRLGNNGSWSLVHVNANLNWVPDEHVAVSAGYGKLFIGDGYRSLLLSDNSADYPYLRLKAAYWKLTYNVIYSRFENERMVDGIRQPKYSVIHYLGANVGKRLQFGFFENTIWLGRDTNFQRGFDVQYLNPLVLMRPVEFSLGSTDNAMMGFTGKYISDPDTFTVNLVSTISILVKPSKIKSNI